jgi:hypothetical protein
MFSQCWRCVHPYDDGWRTAGIRNAVWSHGWKEEGVARLQEIAVAFDCQRDLSVYDITDPSPSCCLSPSLRAPG